MKTNLSHQMLLLGLVLCSAPVFGAERFAEPNNRTSSEVANTILVHKTEKYLNGKKINVYILEGRFFNPENKKPVEGVAVVVTNIKNNWLINLTTDAKGKFSCELNDASVYSVEGKKKQFFNAVSRNFSTVGRNRLDRISLDLPIKKMEIGTPYEIKNISFDINAHTINTSSAKALKSIVELLAQNPKIIVEIACHTDSRGSDKYNFDLSDRRANELRKFLLEKGVDASRITAKGYGETQLLNKCENGVHCKAAQHNINRRIEFKVLRFEE